MSADQVWLEVAKLAVQFVGAIAVARLAVRWALSRYKDEKTWGRQLTAYVEVCSALGEMRLIVGRGLTKLRGLNVTVKILKRRAPSGTLPQSGISKTLGQLRG